MRRSAGLAASLFLTVLSLAGCGKGGVIGSGPLPTPTPIVPKVTNEFPIPAAGAKPGGITLGSDSFLYFTEQGAANIGRVTIGGSFNEYSISSGGGTAGVVPVDITAGPDGNLWFTEQGKGIAKMILGSWQVTEYPLAGSNPTYIITGPVQNTLVFSDPAHNAVGEYNINTASFTQSPALTANANPMGLAVNSANANDVFIAEHDASKIAVWDAVNNTLVGEFSTITPNAGPTSIVQGPDGAMWFTENNVAKIGRMSLTGQMSEFPLSPATSATALVAAHDNNFYFTDQTQNQIGQVGVQPGTVAEFGVPSASAFPAPAPNVFPGKMILGPDARVYFTEPNTNKIGQLNY